MENETLNFLKTQINKLCYLFQDSIFRIEYNNAAQVYFVEVSPDTLLNSELFKPLMSRITTEFLNNNYLGMLSFVNSQSLYKVKNPIDTMKYEHNKIRANQKIINFVEKEIGETSLFIDAINEKLEDHFNSKDSDGSFEKNFTTNPAIAA